MHHVQQKIKQFLQYLYRNKVDVVKVGVLVLFVLWTSFQKYKVFDESGGDFEAYRNATKDLLSGVNPYEYTVKSFTQEYDEWGDEIRHGYAYLPGLMYVQAPLYLLSNAINYPLPRVWRFPLLAVDMAISGILIWVLYKKDNWMRYLETLFAVVVWSFHPFFAVIGSYTNWEPYAVFFLLVALVALEKKPDLAAVMFSIAVAFKTFPVILLPLFLLKTKNKLRFLMIGALIYFVISIPFMGSWEDFGQYIQGSLLVHGSRELQGRPILSYLTLITPLNFYQVLLASLYSALAMLTSWIIPTVLLVKKKITNKYILAMISFGLYFLFTPVLNRTHLIWGIPFLILGLFEATKNKKWIYFVGLATFYVFYAWYLSMWFRGFRFDGNSIYL